MNHMSAAMEEVPTQLLTVSRSEQKYVLSHADAAALWERISRVLVRDAHGGDAGYPVRSLYFDSLNQRDYSEKLAGVEVRRKIRLRTYDADAPSCKLEIKKKRGAHSEKLSVTVSRREAEALSSGDYSPLLHRLGNVREAGVFYETMALGCYRPTVLVTYNRLAFIHPAGDTRITFDSDIRAIAVRGSAVHGPCPARCHRAGGKIQRSASGAGCKGAPAVSADADRVQQIQ